MSYATLCGTLCVNAIPSSAQSIPGLVLKSYFQCILVDCAVLKSNIGLLAYKANTLYPLSYLSSPYMVLKRT